MSPAVTRHVSGVLRKLGCATLDAPPDRPGECSRRFCRLRRTRAPEPHAGESVRDLLLGAIALLSASQASPQSRDRASEVGALEMSARQRAEHSAALSLLRHTAAAQTGSPDEVDSELPQTGRTPSGRIPASRTSAAAPRRVSTLRPVRDGTEAWPEPERLQEPIPSVLSWVVARIEGNSAPLALRSSLRSGRADLPAKPPSP